MLKTHTLLGKALFTLADMDILLSVILLLSVAVIYSGKLEKDIARVCWILILKYSLIPVKCLRMSAFTCISQILRQDWVYVDFYFEATFCYTEIEMSIQSSLWKWKDKKWNKETKFQPRIYFLWE